MPTGYTTGIEDGSITTGKDFLKLCTRAFGIAMELREEPLSIPTPTKFEPNTYYKDRVEEAKTELAKWKSVSFEDAKAEMIKSHTNRTKRYRKIAEDIIKKNEQYNKIRAEVIAWIPPTSEHYNLKSFALEQIDKCIEKQEWIDEWMRQANEKLDDSDEAVERFVNENIESCIQDVKRAEENWEEELKRVSSKNDWMEKFLGSL